MEKNRFKILEEDKDRIAIVVVGYNRLAPIKRLLSSLLSAKYGDHEVPLFISIDCSNNEVLYKYVNAFRWPFGNKYVNIQKERLGLKNHIIQCGNLTQCFKAIVLFEDDIFVSEYFYDYVNQVVDFYKEDKRVGGISLYQHEMVGAGIPISFYRDDSDTYLWQRTASWGECWTTQQWHLFMEWYENFSDSGFEIIDMPEIMKNWRKAWSKYYTAYLIQTKRYIVYPYVSLTTCFGDAGEHSSVLSMLGQTTMQCEKKEYHFKSFDEMVKYDIYGTNESIYDWIGINKEKLCVDWYATNSNIRKCIYLLTPFVLPAKVIKSYGAYLRPLELNIKYNIDGDDIFLYKFESGLLHAVGKDYPFSIINYHLKAFNINLIKRYLIIYYSKKIKNKIKNFF